MRAPRPLRRRAAGRGWCLRGIAIAAGLVLVTSKAAWAQTLPAPASFAERISVAGAARTAEEAPPAIARDRAAPALDARSRYRAIVEKEAAGSGLAPQIAEAVMAVESSYDPAAIGGDGEVGLMQILPSTARMLGFAGSLSQLAVPETNIHYGIAYLAQAWRLAGGDLCTAVMKYRAGHGETRFSYRSVNYCLAVRAKLIARGFPVTGNVPVATFGETASASGCRRKCLGGARVGHVDLAALNMRLSAIVVQARGGH